MRLRSSRSTRHCCCGLGAHDHPDHHPPGLERLDAEHGRLGQDRPTRARDRARAWRRRRGSRRSPRAASAWEVTGTSTTARDHCCDLFPTRRIVPFGTCHTTPSTSRSRVVRRLTPSTVPLATPASTTSPTPNWSSISMNMPERKSFTSDCAPNPSATPTMPAPAMQRRQVDPERLEHRDHRDRPDHDGDDAAHHGADRLGALRSGARLRHRAGVDERHARARSDVNFSTPPLRCLTNRAVSTARDPHEDPRDEQEDGQDADGAWPARRRRRPRPSRR